MARLSQMLAATQNAECCRHRAAPGSQPLPRAKPHLKPGEYPGWNKDLRWTDQPQNSEFKEVRYPIGIHYNCVGAHSDLLLVREVAMMLVMDRLTDKPDWHLKVFDDDIAEKWRQEALAWPEDDLWARIANSTPERWPVDPPKDILSKESVDYAILELRQKAGHFARTGITPTLDATFSIAKSDVLVPRELQDALREAFVRLQADQADHPDFHPNTKGMVQNLVHPSMYPLVYGRSRFLPEEVVGVEDAVDKWAGKGEVIPRRPEWGDDVLGQRQGTRWRRLNTEPGVEIGGQAIHKSYWSTHYQWLPANVKFTDDGGVKFTSYINNLHPVNYRDVYTTIESLIEKALPMWDQCLAQHKYRTWQDSGLIGPGRHKPRIVAEEPDDEHPDNWDIKSIGDMLARKAAEGDEDAAEKLAIWTKGKEIEAEIEAGTRTQPDPEEADSPEEAERLAREEEIMDQVFNFEIDLPEELAEYRKPIHPPMPAFSEGEIDYAVDPSRTLRAQFGDTGLQIIVKFASIELTPENPTFSPGNWHVEGQMNEHIVATALYYLSSENTTPPTLDFRALTTPETGYSVGQSAYHWLESMCGTRLGEGSPCLQRYGSVVTKEGRLLAFPNIFQHRVGEFKLVDESKPGHRRFVALWLVDPLTRVIGTGNVPPQQAGWWAEGAFGAGGKGAKGGATSGGDKTAVPLEIAQLLAERGLAREQLGEVLAAAEGGKAPAGTPKLPPEIVGIVRKELADAALPMTREEAEAHRLKLMQGRSAFQEEARGDWDAVEYNFCEH